MEIDFRVRIVEQAPESKCLALLLPDVTPDAFRNWHQ